MLLGQALLLIKRSYANMENNRLANIFLSTKKLSVLLTLLVPEQDGHIRIEKNYIFLLKNHYKNVFKI